MDKFVFHSIYKEHRLIIEPKTTKVVNDFPTRTKGIAVEFVNHIFDTTDAELAQKIRDWINTSKTVEVKEVTQAVSKPVDVLKKLKGQ